MSGVSSTSVTTTELLPARDSNDPMFPSRQPPPSKRKGEDGNPLNQLAKKARTDSSTKSAAAKRKLIGEEQPGGLIIVRASSARPHHSQEVRPTQADPHPQPPARHSSVPPPSRVATSGTLTNGTKSGHPSKKFRAESNELSTSAAVQGRDGDVLGSVAEADEDEDVRQMQSETDILRRKSLAASAKVDPAFQFPPPGTSSKPAKLNQSRGRIREISQPLPLQETPQQERNRFLRGEGGHRRKSSLTRGKRISSAYQSTGVIAQPHTSVRDSSFYKHIDIELPEPQRAQQLLIWCSHRAVNELADQIAQVASSSSTRNTNASGKDPPLSQEDAQLLKGVGEDLVKMLAEKKIDTNVYSRPGDEDTPRQLKENEQNVRNRAREVQFNAHIQRLKQEDEAWVEVGSSYNAFRTAVLSELEERKKEFPSAKARGKQPATAEDIALWDMNERDLPEHFRGRDGLTLARRLVNPAPAKSALAQRMEELELTADRLHSLAHAALEGTRLAEADLNRRFSLLNISLASRIQPHNSSLTSSSTALSSYLPSSSSRPPPTTDPQALLRAMSRVDAERPQTQVGDAARRAAREVQRAHDASGGIAERRLTGVPPPTPRKPPGTPRRATTPARGR